ncbi:hypothetical protein FEM03_04730 [Phragmitibacter flavus]|uniref:Uncharacterized protein n=1 Tax=Phragmitibacter flavus TaxID=2576071 RepID=A0A5R8KI86_9BACT|nr:hypothetical protein [Phragmitibacter flavus]TLD72033.1 hypothetical protein FEM03_04730 [Phragmitibacter flavus]
MNLGLFALTLIAVAAAFHFKSVSDDLRSKLDEHEQTKAQLEALREEFDYFKVKRRAGIIGQKFPVLELVDGSKLHQAEVKSINAATINVMHEVGVSRLKLCDLKDEFLKWEAVWSKSEAEKELQLLTQRDELAAKIFAEESAKIQREQVQTTLTSHSQNQSADRDRKISALTAQMGQIDAKLYQLRIAYNKRQSSVGREVSRPLVSSGCATSTVTTRNKINASGPVLTRLSLEIGNLESYRQKLLAQQEALRTQLE